MIICLCKGVRDRDVHHAIQQGARCMSELKRCTGAGTVCGACRQELRYFLHHKGKAEHHRQESQGGNFFAPTRSFD